MSNLEETADRLNALGNPTRLQIFRLLVRAGDVGMSVGRVQEVISVPGSTLSHHLKLLDTVKLIEREKQGTTLICRARYDVMNSVIGYLADECCLDTEDGERQGHLHWRNVSDTGTAS